MYRLGTIQLFATCSWAVSKLLFRNKREPVQIDSERLTNSRTFWIFFFFFLRTTRGARNPNLQFVMTHASHVCSQHVVVCLCLFFFACFVVRYLCRSGCRQNYYLTPSLPRLPIYLFFFLLLPTILSLTQKISARLKLVSVPFSSLLLDIGQQLSFFYSRYFWPTSWILLYWLRAHSGSRNNC